MHGQVSTTDFADRCQKEMQRSILATDGTENSIQHLSRKIVDARVLYIERGYPFALFAINCLAKTRRSKRGLAKLPQQHQPNQQHLVSVRSDTPRLPAFQYRWIYTRTNIRLRLCAACVAKKSYREPVAFTKNFFHSSV